MANRFTSRLVFEDDGGFPFTLLESLSYEGTRWVTVPAGFKTDLASIPQVLWNILPPIGRYDKAAVIHDYLYQTQCGVTRSESDSLLREAMEVCGVNRVERWLIYSGVRVGGWVPWGKYGRKR